MTTVTIAFEAKGERGREGADYDDSMDNYATGSPGKGRTISGSIVGKRGQTITFTRYAGGNRGLHVSYNGSAYEKNTSNGAHGGDGGGAAALVHNTQHIVIAGGGGGRGGRRGNSGGDAGSYATDSPAGDGTDGGTPYPEGGGGGNNGAGGTFGVKYEAGRAAWTGNSGGSYTGGDGGDGEAAGDGAGGGGAGFGGGGGGGGHGDNENSNSNNSGGGGGGDSMIHTTSTDDVYVSGTPTESFNTDTTAQVIITYSGTAVTLNANNNQFTFSTPTVFSNVSLTYNKTTSDTNITLTNFSDSITKTYTYTMSEVGNSNYTYNSTTPFSGTNINNVYIGTDNILYWNRPNPSATASIRFDVRATATVTGITETSFFTVVMEFNNKEPKFNSISDQAKYILSDQTVSWDLTGDFEGDEEYSFNSGGPYTSSDPSMNIYQSTLLVGTATYNITERKLYFDGSGLENDNIQSSFNVWVKDAYTSAVSSDTVTVTQYKRLYKHENIKSFDTTVSNTGFKTPSNVDIATLFQPKSLLNFVTPANTGKFSKSSSTPTPIPVDFSNIFGEYKSDYSGNSIISTDTGFQIGGTDIRHIYAAKKTSLDIFDTSPGRKNYRFSLTENTDVLIIVVGGGGAGKHGSKGGQGGHGGKIILHETTLFPGDYDLSFNVGAGESNDLYDQNTVTRRGGNSSITGTSNGGTLINYNTSLVAFLTPRVNNNNGGDNGPVVAGEGGNGDAQDGGFQLKYGVNTYDIGGGGGAGKIDGLPVIIDEGNGYYGGDNGDTYDNYNSPKPRNSNYGGGGGGGYTKIFAEKTTGSSGGHGLCAILFKPNTP
jgi:hypothetical protein